MKQINFEGLSFQEINFTQKQEKDEYQAMCQGLYADDATEHALNPAHALRTLQALEENPYLGKIMMFWSQKNIVGYAYLANFWSNEWGGNVLHIDEIFVKESYRGKGITKSFFEWLDNTYKNPQKNDIFFAKAYALEVSPKNPKAQKLYEKLGFVKKYYNYMIKV